jgi:hypothetical protein
VDSINNKTSQEEIWKIFDSWWIASKSEIFRLQLLNEYHVEEEEKFFNEYKKGKQVNLQNDINTIEWLKKLKNKKVEGVRNINLMVIDLPLSDYLKFSVNTYLLDQKRYGRESFFIEREKVAEIVRGVQDYWLFDNEKLLLMNYDNGGHFLSASEPMTDMAIVSRYIRLKEAMLTKAMPMEKFLPINGISIKHNKVLKLY